MDKYIIKNFINSLNNFDGSDDSRNDLKNYVCYLSEHKNEFLNSYPILELLHVASQKLKVFGYDVMNNISNIETDNLSGIIDEAMVNYHTSALGDDANKIILDGFQKDIVDKYQSLQSRRIMVSAPTSFGKSYLLQEILYNNRYEYKNVMLVLPTIALLNENVNKYQGFIKDGKLNYKIVSTNYEDLDLNARNMFIFTPERALKFLGRYNLKINFFFFDEVYKIEERLDITKDNGTDQDVVSGSDKRASAFRTCLYLLSNKVKDYYIVGPFLDIENPESYGLKKFIEKNEIYKFQIKFDPTLRITYDAWKTTTITENNSLIPEARSFETKLMSGGTQEDKFLRIKKFIDEHNLGKTIVYLNYPSQIVKLLNNIDIFDVQPLKNKELEDFINHLKSKYNVNIYNISSVEYWSLVKCLEFGIGIHHGKMPKYIQNEILRQFNKPDGLKYLFCTSTIIEGVNTAAKNVVMLSNSYGSGDVKKFAFKNIKGRAGRYYSNFVGNLFYCSSDQKKLDNDENVKLEFLNFGQKPLLNVDLDNTEENDLFESNRIEKTRREQLYNKDLLPDEIFYQNRLFDRLEQEEILNKMLDDNTFEEVYSITQKVIKHELGYIELVRVVLDLEENLLLGNLFKNKTATERKNILEKYKCKLIAILKCYETSGFTGLLKYQLKNMPSESSLKEKMDEKYNIVFDDIRTHIEYDIPKYLSLFQSLFSHACKIRNKKLGNESLDEMIKFYEVGASNDFGRLLIERGFPSESAKTIEIELKQTKTNFSSNDEMIDYIDHHPELISKLDNYETRLYHRIIDLYKKS